MGSRRTLFLLCLVSLISATALLAIGTNTGLWIAGRLLQGLSAGMLWIACLALLNDTVGSTGIGKAVGTIGIPMSIGPVLGPLVGGVTYAHGGYSAAFGLMFAMLAVDVVLRLALIEKSVARTWLDTEVARPDMTEPHCESTSPAPRPESFNDPQASTEDNEGFNNETRNSSCTLLCRLFPAFKLVLSFQILIGLIGGLLQSSLNVAFDSTLPLIVKSLFGWEQTGQGLIFIAILLPSLLQPVSAR